MKQCPRCREMRHMTHRIKSDVSVIEVCYNCGLDAEIVQGDAPGAPGGLTITIFDRHRRHTMPLGVYECFLCHEKLNSRQQYFDHYRAIHLDNK